MSRPILLLSTICCGGIFNRSVFAFSPSPPHGRPTEPSPPSIDDSPSAVARRDVLRAVAGAALLPSSSIVAPAPARAAAGAPLPLRGSSGGTVRVEEIGGGLDLLSPPRLGASDVFYPASMVDTRWRVQRVLTSVEGDLGQAALAWKLLGGSSDERAFTSKLTEAYDSRFVAAPDAMDDAAYEYDGKVLRAAILDRKFELASRVGGLGEDAVRWDGGDGRTEIDYARSDDANDAVRLAVVRRKIEKPSDDGFGSDEVYRIQSSAGGIFGGSMVYRAARVRRRYRRGFDEATGRRTLECIEIVTTHRVLDGVAGMELPTSTSKSRLRYTQL